MTAFELNWVWLKHYSSYRQWQIDWTITEWMHWINLNNVWQTVFLIKTDLGRSVWNWKAVPNLNENIHLLPRHWSTRSTNAKWHKTNVSIPSEIKKRKSRLGIIYHIWWQIPSNKENKVQLHCCKRLMTPQPILRCEPCATTTASESARNIGASQGVAVLLTAADSTHLRLSLQL